MNIMNNIQQIFTQYLGQDANIALVDLQTKYKNFEVYTMNYKLITTAQFISNRIIIRHDDNNVVTSVSIG